MHSFVSRKHILVSSVATACLLATAPALADAKIGVTSAVNPQAVGQPPAAQERTLFVGVDMQADERVRTADKGQVQLLFLDGSALSVGPNSDMVIDKFVYDPAKKVGELGFSAARGVFRLVGGKISKNSDVEFKTPTATIGIRGGIALVRIHEDGRVVATFLFGDRMRVTSGGTTTSTTRPGTIEAPPSGPPSAPRPVTEGDLRTALPLLEGAAGSGSGSDEPGEDRRLADSGFARSGSETPLAPVRERETTPSVTEDEPTREVPDIEVPEGHAVGRTFIGRATFDPWGTDFDPETLRVTRNPEDSTSVIATELGDQLRVVLPDGETALLPYRIAERFHFTEADTNLDQPLMGYAEVNKHSFSYMIFPNDYGTLAIEGETGTSRPLHLYGGTQTTAGALPTSGVGAYYPTESSDLLDTETVSPVYVRWQAAGRSPTLHAAVGIYGQGIDQTSTFFGQVGAVFHEQGSDTPAVGGAAIGTNRYDASYELDRQVHGIASAPLGTGSAVYGPSGEEILIIPDLMEYTDSGFIRHPANGIASWGTGGYSSTWFTEVLVRGETPSYVGAPATTRMYQGYSAGLLDVTYFDPYSGPVREYSRFVTTDPSTLDGVGPGGLTVSTDSVNNSVSATASFYTFDGTIGDGGGVIEFGGHGAADIGRSAAIDDNIFGAIDSASRPVQIDGEVTGSSQIFMVTHQAVPNDGWLPSGVSLCECSYLKWGWWMGTISDDEGIEASAHLATWVAGQLWGVEVPMAGTASYNGHIVGNVYKDVGGVGRSYVAAGSFRNDWDFGTREGAVTINNFDGMDFTGGAISLNGRDIIGDFAQNGGAPAVVGQLEGSFFVNPGAGAGAMPAHMAGQFVMQNVSGQPLYSAAGTFAAQK